MKNRIVTGRFVALTVAEMFSSALVGAVRTSCAVIAVDEGLTPLGWLDWIPTAYANLNVKITDGFGFEVVLDTSIFEASDQQIDDDSADRWYEAVRTFFRVNTAAPARPNGVHFVTRSWQPHFCILGSVIGAHRPDLSASWPRQAGIYRPPARLVAANDNHAPSQRG